MKFRSTPLRLFVPCTKNGRVLWERSTCLGFQVGLTDFRGSKGVGRTRELTCTLSAANRCHDMEKFLSLYRSIFDGEDVACSSFPRQHRHNWERVSLNKLVKMNSQNNNPEQTERKLICTAQTLRATHVWKRPSVSVVYFVLCLQIRTVIDN